MKGKEVKFRVISANDLEKLAELLLELHQHELKQEKRIELKEMTLGNVKEKVQEFWKNKNSRGFVAECEGEMIGFVMGVIEKSPDYLREDFIGMIESCYVEKSFRKRGVARELISMMYATFSRNKVEFVTLGVLAKNSLSRKAWEALGFKDYYVKMFKLIK